MRRICNLVLDEGHSVTTEAELRTDEGQSATAAKRPDITGTAAYQLGVLTGGQDAINSGLDRIENKVEGLQKQVWIGVGVVIGAGAVIQISISVAKVLLT